MIVKAHHYRRVDRYVDYITFVVQTILVKKVEMSLIS